MKDLIINYVNFTEMKKVFFYATLFVALAMFASCDKDEIISFSKLPASSQAFIQTHFPDVTTTHIIKDKDLFDKSYTAYLANGFEIDFEKNGDWDEVDGHINPVPQSILNLLPDGIVEYSAANFPSSEIVSVNKEHYGYEIELLGTRVELKFNSSGGFIGYDD